MKLKAFTMAEVLVTLGIVSVVAALTLPGLFRTQPNKEMVMFRKAYYMTSRIVNELVNDEEYYPDASGVNGTGFAHTSLVATGSAEREPMVHGRSVSGDSKFCDLFASKLNISRDNGCARRIPLANGGNIVTSDGMIWSLPAGADGRFNAGEMIDVDVNGTKAPNCRECTDPDQFRIQVDPDGRIVVLGEVAQEYLSTSSLNKTYSEILQDIKNK